jgi:acetoin utilization protein AcuC
MAFSSKAHYHAARELADLAAEPGIAGLLALGGGGYNRASIADAWTSVIQGILDSENN